MSYDLHLVRTENWFDASSDPIKEEEVNALITEDPELEWSTTDYVDMADGSGSVKRYWMIEWCGQPCFWWYRDQIQCSGPDDAQKKKLAQMARVLNAFTVGDDGERYELRRGLFGRERLVVRDANS